MKRSLPNTTLLGIDCVNVERLQAAMDICEEGFQFGAVKLLTSLPTTDPRVVAIPHIGTIEAYSQFCIAELKNYVETDYVLIVQHDGFILTPSSWTDEFLKYDYIGAPWLVSDWLVRDFNFPVEWLGTKVVGNGGFCLRSKKFLEVSAKLLNEGKIPKVQPEDTALCVWHRDLLEAEGIVFAPPELAERFSLEGEHEPFEKQFGFHGLSWTNIDPWIEAHPEHPFIVESYRQARAEHFERQRKRWNK